MICFVRIAQILLRGALRRARRVFKPGIPGSTVTYAYTPDSLDAGYSVLTPSNAVLTRALFRDPQRRGLILSVSNLVNGVDSGSSFDYTYDALGRPVVRNMDEFGYNPRGEIAWARYGTNTLSDVYDYDFIGNFTSNRLRGAWSQFEANELNEYETITTPSTLQPFNLSTTELAYDADGNLLTNGVWSYAYDSENRLSVVCSNDIVVTENAYDPFYRRVFRREPTGSYGYLYDDWSPIRETAFTTEIKTAVHNYWGKDLSETLQGAGCIGGLLAVERTNGVFFSSCDNRGNIVAYHESAGGIVARFSFNAFGQSFTQAKQQPSSFPFRFSSKQFENESSSCYFGYRYYSPTLGRWLNRDPDEEYSDINLFLAFRNSPVRLVDGLGREVSVITTPESAESVSGMGWAFDSLPATRGGQTIPLWAITVCPIKIDDKLCAIKSDDGCWGLDVKIKIVFQLFLNKEKNPFSLDHAYGHEQQHIIAFLKDIQLDHDFQNALRSAKGYHTGKKSWAEQQAKEVKKEIDRYLLSIKYRGNNHEGRHPKDGEKHNPIGTRPDNPSEQPEAPQEDACNDCG